MTLRVYGKTGGATTLAVGLETYTISGDDYDVTIPTVDERALPATAVRVAVGERYAVIERIPVAVLVDVTETSETTITSTVALDIERPAALEYRELGADIWMRHPATFGVGTSHELTVGDLVPASTYELRWIDHVGGSYASRIVAVSTDVADDVGGDGLAVVVTLVESTATTLVVQAQIEQDAPAALEYRVVGDSAWSRRQPTEDSSAYGATIAHVQTISGLQPETAYELRWIDHIGGSYVSDTVVASTIAASTGDLAIVLDIQGQPVTALGSWTEAQWRDIVNGLPTAYTPTNMHHLSIIDEGGKKMIRQRHQAASNGSDRVIGPFDLTNRQSIRVRMTIEVESNFSWGTTSFSGKLGFGVGGGANTAGGTRNPKGWTLRPSWDADGEITAYSYAATRNNGGNAEYGEEIGTGFFITKGVPFLLEYRVVMNSTFGSRDGTLELWVNGDLLIDLGGIGWMTQAYGSESAPIIDRLMWSQFHGGANSAWSPSPSPTYARVYDVSYE